MLKALRVGLLALATAVWALSLWAQEPRGTLVFDVKPFTSEIDLKEKVEKQLKSGGIEWGLAEGQLVVSMVNKRFIRFELPNLTRYGEKKTLELAPGDYRITCVGFAPEGGLSVEKALRKGAYFNLDVVRFKVEAGKTATVEVLPIIQKKSTFFVKMFIPNLVVKISEGGAAGAESVINERTPASIAWEDYNGPLKF
jgi:hypothetical protein